MSYLQDDDCDYFDDYCAPLTNPALPVNIIVLILVTIRAIIVVRGAMAFKAASEKTRAAAERLGLPDKNRTLSRREVEPFLGKGADLVYAMLGSEAKSIVWAGSPTFSSSLNVVGVFMLPIFIMYLSPIICLIFILNGDPVYPMLIMGSIMSPLCGCMCTFQGNMLLKLGEGSFVLTRSHLYLFRPDGSLSTKYALPFRTSLVTMTLGRATSDDDAIGNLMIAAVPETVNVQVGVATQQTALVAVYHVKEVAQLIEDLSDDLGGAPEVNMMVGVGGAGTGAMIQTVQPASRGRATRATRGTGAGSGSALKSSKYSFCPACGASSTGSRYCGECGASLMRTKGTGRSVRSSRSGNASSSVTSSAASAEPPYHYDGTLMDD
jgi:ribosomal protein L32